MSNSYQDDPFLDSLDASDDTSGNGNNPSLNGNSTPCIGRIGAPPQKEATSTGFYFWIPPDGLVEKTQIVTCQSTIAGAQYAYHAIVNEVYRQSRKRSMSNEIDEADGDINYRPPFDNDGFTYASASILRSPVLAPPQERSPVYLASAAEARTAYGAEDIENGLEIGLIKNGATQIAGPGIIDLDYLLGANGGHMNVNGSAGRGTKSSFLLFVNWLLLRKAKLEQKARPSAGDRTRIVPIILNVKGLDLFHIDRGSNRYRIEEHFADWEALGIEKPQPFENVTFYAPQMPGGDVPVPTGRPGEVTPYSWSLSNIIANGLFSYLFAEVDANDANFGALVLDVETWLTTERTADDGTITRSLRQGDTVPRTFRLLLDWVDRQGQGEEGTKWRNHHSSTWKKLYRRLLKLVYECKGVLRIDDQQGNPLVVTRADTSDPLVVDLSTLAGKPEIQRFVVATIFRQLVDARTGTSVQPGLVYLVTLDELNRFAPRGASDAITKLIENVAAEMRSQGIILLGAQQQASKVSEKVIENAALRVLGRTGTLELDATAWRFLSASAKSKAALLQQNEKLVIQDNFREPMHIRVPFPVWAMNPREVLVPENTDAPVTPDDEILTY
ncbi:MAG TPA: ATP-binding protein [Ktedonobacteraceae bacterium]|nr:ATP-binding protein [Ktedonobacteraceae bacterium]